MWRKKKAEIVPDKENPIMESTYTPELDVVRVVNPDPRHHKLGYEQIDHIRINETFNQKFTAVEESLENNHVQQAFSILTELFEILCFDEREIRNDSALADRRQPDVKWYRENRPWLIENTHLYTEKTITHLLIESARNASSHNDILDADNLLHFHFDKLHSDISEAPRVAINILHRYQHISEIREDLTLDYFIKGWINKLTSLPLEHLTDDDREFYQNLRKQFRASQESAAKSREHVQPGKNPQNVIVISSTSRENPIDPQRSDNYTEGLAEIDKKARKATRQSRGRYY